MPATCIVRGCKSRSNQGCGIRFHRLPWRDDLLCKQWLIRAGKSEHELTGKRMSQFKNARICSLHFTAGGKGTSAALPSKNIPDFERQEAVAGLLQLTVPYIALNQRNVDVHQINPDTNTENTGTIPETAEDTKQITEPQTIACSDTNMEDTANVLKTVEDIIPMTTPQTTINDDDMIISQQSLLQDGAQIK